MIELKENKTVQRLPMSEVNAEITRSDFLTFTNADLYVFFPLTPRNETTSMIWSKELLTGFLATSYLVKDATIFNENDAMKLHMNRDNSNVVAPLPVEVLKAQKCAGVL